MRPIDALPCKCQSTWAVMDSNQQMMTLISKARAIVG